MPLFIFSSDKGGWKKSWAIAIIIAVSVLSLLELLWRFTGREPTIIDDQTLWSIERGKIGKTDREIVLIGSSRMLAAVSPKSLHTNISEFTIANLAIDGSCANDVLRDLADDEKFKGIVIVDITTKCILFGNKDEVNVNKMIRYFHTMYNVNSKYNRYLSTFIQENLCIIDPSVNFIKILGNIVLRGGLPPLRYWTTHEDRSQSIDYEKVKIDEYRAGRIQKVKKYYKALNQEISSDTFRMKVEEIENWVEKIQKRGGKVVFIYFPVSDEHWELDEDYFPKMIYWDTFASVTKAETIHFKDVKDLDKFKCPDTSHIDFRDAFEFTRLLSMELMKRNIVEVGN